MISKKPKRHRSAATATATPTAEAKKQRGKPRKLHSRGSGQRIWNSEKHSPTGGKIRGAESGYGFWTRKTHSPTRGQNPGGKIPATDFALRKPLTLGGKIRVAKSKLRIWSSENHSPTGRGGEGGKIQGHKTSNASVVQGTTSLRPHKTIHVPPTLPVLSCSCGPFRFPQPSRWSFWPSSFSLGLFLALPRVMLAFKRVR